MSYRIGGQYYYPHEIGHGTVGLIYVAKTGAHGFKDHSGRWHETHCPACNRPSRRQGCLVSQERPLKSVSLCKFGCDGPIISIHEARSAPDPAPTWPTRTRIIGNYHLMDELTVEVDAYGGAPYYTGTNKPVFKEAPDGERVPTPEEREEMLEAELSQHCAHVRDYQFHQVFA